MRYSFRCDGCDAEYELELPLAMCVAVGDKFNGPWFYTDGHGEAHCRLVDDGTECFPDCEDSSVMTRIWGKSSAPFKFNMRRSGA